MFKWKRHSAPTPSKRVEDRPAGEFSVGKRDDIVTLSSEVGLIVYTNHMSFVSG